MDRGVISWTPLGRSEKLRPPPVGRYLRSRAEFRASSAPGPIRTLSIARANFRSAAKQRSLELGARDRAREVWDFYVASPDARVENTSAFSPLFIVR